MVPKRWPSSTRTMFSGSDALHMTVWHPAAVAMRAAVSLVAMPPVPHWVPCVVVSACSSSHGGCLLAASLQRAIKKALLPVKVASLFPM